MNTTPSELKACQHELKTWIPYFEEILTGNKTFEFRRNDRDFKVGDTLLLREYDHPNLQYTGRQLSVRITYKMEGGNFGLPHKMCIMSITRTTPSPDSGEKVYYQPKDEPDHILEPPHPQPDFDGMAEKLTAALYLDIGIVDSVIFYKKTHPLILSAINEAVAKVRGELATQINISALYEESRDNVVKKNDQLKTALAECERDKKRLI